MSELITNYAKNTVGPVMYRYTRWVLERAKKKGIKRLYFLARDGYLLCEIAKILCKKYGYDIEVRYLYCSRASLRMPSYHIISEEEMYKILLLGGYYLTPKSVLLRAGLSISERKELYGELGVDEPDRCLGESEFNALCEKIKASEKYKSLVLERSRQAYLPLIDYLKEEGLFEGDTVALVDSGWTGSMQRSLRQLLSSAGYRGKMVGFYFGMYVTPNDADDGEYLTFYFDRRTGLRRKALFNNNLFECMLSAPHAMTLCYRYGENGVVPVLADGMDEKMLSLVREQIKGALEYAESITVDTRKYSYKRERRVCFKILKRIMTRPTREEAEMLSAFTFCDDVTEGYSLSLANGEMKKSLKKYMLIHRIIRKLRGRKQDGEAELFWPYGVVAFCRPILRPWYRLNISAWQWLKYMLGK